ncbi:hypothetical protein GCM10027516_33440 [Niabella aquatica]
MVEEQPLFDHGVKGTPEEFLNVVMPSKMIGFKRHIERSYKVAFIKIYYFFEFCINDPEYVQYIQKFFDYYNLKHYSVYIYYILDIYLNVIGNEQTSNKIVIPKSASFVTRILDTFCANDREVRAIEDHRHLRQFPLYKFKPGEYLFLNPDFFIDKLYNGFLFDFVSVMKELRAPEFNFGILKRDMGNRFSETLLFYAVMKCFKDCSDTSLSGTELKVYLKEGEPDFYLRKDKCIFLFEFKDTTIRSDVKVSGDAQRIKQELVEKFETTSKGQSKAIHQLLHSIQTIKQGKFNFDPIEPDEMKIYPILVYTDMALETEGVNYFLDGKFQHLIKQRPNFSGVQALTLFNLDTLILYQDYFQKGKLDLGDCLDAYITYTGQNNLGNQMMSFDEYILYYIPRKGLPLITVPQVLNDIMEKYKDINKGKE